MVLGLVWRLILTTQIANLNETTAAGLVGDEHKVDSSAKQALLTWVQQRTRPLGVEVDNFGKDWKSGMAFLALLASEDPEIFNFGALDPSRSEDNLRLAFDVAQKEFGIAPLLDVEDLAPAKPDERSVMTYVSAIAHRLQVAAREKNVSQREQELEKAAREKELLLKQNSAQELQRAQQMKEEADRQMREAERLAQESKRMQGEETQRLAALQKRLAEQEAALAAQANALKAQQESHLRAQQEAEQQRQQMERDRVAAEERMRATLEAEQRRLAEEAERRRQADDAERKRLLDEAERRRAADEAERRRLAEQQLAAEQARVAAEQQHAAEQARLAAEQQRVAAEQQRLADAQRQQQNSAQAEMVERAFGDAANTMDHFLVQERQKLTDPNLNLQTAGQMVNLGFPYGDNLLGRVRGAAQQAMAVGLQQNRFTQQSLPGLEERWNQQKSDTQARLQQLQQRALAPAPVLPSVPFSASFQPFQIVKKKEVALLLDITASMNAPIARNDATPRLKVVKDAVKLLVAQMPHLDTASKNGLHTITFAGGVAQDIAELTVQNFEAKWSKINWEGNTRIMPAWKLMHNAFAAKFGRLPEPQQPALLALLVTDGDSLDIQEFERTLASDQNSYVVVALVGWGEEHDLALRSFNAIARTNPRLKVIPLQGAHEAALIAGTLTSMAK
jgi:hypothetical protein